jgi:hypothetical protein
MRLLLTGCTLIATLTMAQAEDSRLMTRERAIEVVGNMIATHKECGLDSIPVSVRAHLVELAETLDPIDRTIATANGLKLVRRVGKDRWCQRVKEEFATFGS